jgi:amino acid adenylation domain-containing protein
MSDTGARWAVTNLDEARGPGPVPGGPAPELRTVPALFAEQAARSPDAVALSAGQRLVSYRALADWSLALAGELRAAGVGPGSVVAVLMPRSVEAVVALLAVLRAGGAYLALDLSDPPERLGRLVELAGVRVAVGAAEAGAAAWLPTSVRMVDVSADLSYPVPFALPEPDPESPAYVCFTSGSTGTPRGVLVPHRAISRLVAAQWLGVREDDVFLQAAPLAFDASTFEIWTPLAHGARLAVLRPGPVDLRGLAETIAAERLSVLWLTAGLFHQMVADWPAAFGGLRHVVAGGDVISPAHLARLLSIHPGLTFTNGYGPTENTTFTTCWTTRSVAGDQPVPIGRPIGGTTVAVLDRQLRPVPAGARGELWASGAGLAIGYLGDPAATAERFLPDPFSAEPGGRMYRTGDIAGWRPDGTLGFHGRSDQQVKVHGFRVEPAAAEAELDRCPEVRQAAVVAQREPGGSARLIAYVDAPDVPRGEWAALGGRLRTRLLATLPAYAVPMAVIVCPGLPLTSSGKVDRRSLPASTLVPRDVANDYEAPRDEIERRLVALWGRALGVEPVGAEDDFFELGGHSMLAAELLGTLRREFGVELSARAFYQQPTIREIAAKIAGARDGGL